VARTHTALRRRDVPQWRGDIALGALLLCVLGAPPCRATSEGGLAAPPPPGADLIERAWQQPAESLVHRVDRTRIASIEAGVWSLDPAARTLLRAPGSPLERASAAVALAPDLPAARMALASALWRRGDAPLGALHEAIAALSALSRHLEAALWFAGSALAVLAAGLVLGGLACALSSGVLAAPHAAHDLGDALGGDAPAFARMALLTAFVCTPALLGEGLLGLAIGAFALGALYGSARERIALCAAAAAVWVGAFPLAALAGRSVEALTRDPVVRAASAVDHGRPTAVDLAVLRTAAYGDRNPDAPREEGSANDGPGLPADPLAQRALARLARREGRLGEADARYQELLRTTTVDAALANDAANVRLRLGHVDAALELYQGSLALDPSALAYFNLSQAHGRVFDVEGLTRALERAQALDGDLVAELSRVQASSESRDFVVDFPLPPHLLWSRLAQAGDGRAFAAELRAPLAPGRLGQQPGMALAGLAAPVVLASLAGRRLRRSRWCARCGRRTCPRCDGTQARAELCEACHRLYFQPEQTQRELRIARIAVLEGRRRRLDRVETLTALLVPGAAGIRAMRPLRGLVACILFAVAAAAFAWRSGIVRDDAVAGLAGTAALLVLAGVAALSYAALVTTSLVTRRGS
jgi:tetratricopeptide (TPR) repeat protein